MHKGERVPLAGEGVAMSEALVTMTEKSFGCLGVVDRRGRLAGIITVNANRLPLLPFVSVKSSTSYPESLRSCSAPPATSDCPISVASAIVKLPVATNLPPTE